MYIYIYMYTHECVHIMKPEVYCSVYFMLKLPWSEGRPISWGWHCSTEWFSCFQLHQGQHGGTRWERIARKGFWKKTFNQLISLVSPFFKEWTSPNSKSLWSFAPNPSCGALFLKPHNSTNFAKQFPWSLLRSPRFFFSKVLWSWLFPWVPFLAKLNTIHEACSTIASDVMNRGWKIHALNVFFPMGKW